MVLFRSVEYEQDLYQIRSMENNMELRKHLSPVDEQNKKGKCTKARKLLDEQK